MADRTVSVRIVFAVCEENDGATYMRHGAQETWEELDIDKFVKSSSRTIRQSAIEQLERVVARLKGE